MKIVQADQLPFERGLEHRGGMFHYCRMLEGEPGTIGNFQLSYGRIGGDFFSPRHRHNFEQIRYQVEGTLDFARDGKLEAGMVRSQVYAHRNSLPDRSASQDRDTRPA